MAQCSLSASKKRRLNPRPLASNMNDEEGEEMAARLLYFDILPANAIGNIVRFLSESPRAEKWASSIDFTDISGLYAVKGELGTFMLTVCTALRLGVKATASFSSMEDEPEEAMVCDTESLLDLSLPERVAESFCTLDVWNDVWAWAGQVDFISETFPNIRKLLLRLGCDERDWIEKLGSNIEYLHCDYFSLNIAKYCPHLRHLYLFSMKNYDSNVKSWEKVGEKLETLSLCITTDNINVIEFVEKFFRKIKRLELSGGNYAVREAISKCIASYGNQLEHVRLDSLTENQLQRVKTACRKTRMVLITKDVHLGQTVKIVGSQLEEAFVYSVDESQEMDRDLLDWSACTNIEKSKFNGRVTIAFIERFFKSPKYHLKSFDLWMHGEVKKLKVASSLIAKGTGGLETFIFRCDTAALGMLKELVDRNQSIQNVWIYVTAPIENEVAADIVKTFLKSPSLKNLQVKSAYDVPKIAEIERICRTVGCRRVCISVLPVCYLR